jgi:hypothetical protein
MLEYELMAYAILTARYPELMPVIRKLRASCLLTEALKAHRSGDRQRAHAMIRSAMGEGAIIQGAAVWLATTVFGQQSAALSSGQPAGRPPWVKRLSQFLMQR